MKRIIENRKITLTLGQLKKLVKESFDETKKLQAPVCYLYENAFVNPAEFGSYSRLLITTKLMSKEEIALLYRDICDETGYSLRYCDPVIDFTRRRITEYFEDGRVDMFNKIFLMGNDANQFPIRKEP